MGQDIIVHIRLCNPRLTGFDVDGSFDFTRDLDILLRLPRQLNTLDNATEVRQNDLWETLGRSAA
jgi:hypothetical protein